jgi:hypothetical protein
MNEIINPRAGGTVRQTRRTLSIAQLTRQARETPFNAGGISLRLVGKFACNERPT